MKEYLPTIIFALIVPFISIFIGYKTKNMGRDEKYNRRSQFERGERLVMTKCSYCHQDAIERISADVASGIGEQYYCSDICKEEITKYIDDAKNHKVLFLSLTLGSILIMVLANGVVTALNFDSRYMLFITSLAVAVVGSTILKFPFSTPETIQWLGIKKAKIVARVLGSIIIIFGFVILIIGKSR